MGLLFGAPDLPVGQSMVVGGGLRFHEMADSYPDLVGRANVGSHRIAGPR